MRPLTHGNRDFARYDKSFSQCLPNFFDMYGVFGQSGQFVPVDLSTALSTQRRSKNRTTRW